MKTPSNDGGPAFPRPVSHSDEGGTHFGFTGMTLRDYFAGQVLSQLAHDFCECDPLHYKVVAFRSYELADLMIAERERKEDAP